MDDKHLPNKNEEFMEEEGKMRKALHFKSNPIQTDKAALWSRIESSIEDGAQVRALTSRRKMLYWIGGVAASLALFLSVYFLGTNKGTPTVTAALAETEQHTLPDQSAVTLGAGSALYYDAPDWSEERSLRLEGEAFFVVNKGSAFTVQTEKGNVQVLGTEFNVRTWGTDFSVACREGRVAVSLKTGERIEITAGETVRLNEEGKLVKSAIETAEVANWMEGQFDFPGHSLMDILEELERQFDYEIKFIGQADATPYKFTFNTSEDFAEIIDRIKYEARLDGTINGKTVQLSRQ